MICIPITSGTNKEALLAIERSCRLADLIELRMDLISKGNLAELINAARKESGSIKIIVTCRKKEEAAMVGAARRIKNSVENTIDKKILLLKGAIELEADFIDIELAEGRAVIEELNSFCAKKGGKTGIIVSYHDIKNSYYGENFRR
jgi:3-dehydroquinate dehydratase type I